MDITDIDTLLSAPLIAASSAHAQLCETTRQFIDSCMYDDGEDNIKKPIMIEFEYEKYSNSAIYNFYSDGVLVFTGTLNDYNSITYIDDNNSSNYEFLFDGQPLDPPYTGTIESYNEWEKIDTNTTKVEVSPGIRLRVPLIAILTVPTLGIDSVNVDMTVEINEVVETTSESTPGNNFYKQAYSMRGKLSSENKTTRTTNNASTYQVSVQASKQGPSEGLSRLLDMLNDSINPES